MKLISPRLLQYAKSSRAALGLTIALGLAGGLLTVIQARLLSRVISGVFLGGQNLKSSAPLLGLLLLLFWGHAATLWAAEISAKHLALRVKTSLREKLYAHLQKLGPLYVRGERTGELVNTATEGIEALDAYFSEYLPQLVLAALVPVTFLLFVFPLDALSGWVLLLTAPLIPIFMALIGHQADALTQKQWRTLSRMSAHFLDVLQGLTTLKLLGRSRAQIEVIRQVSVRFRDRTLSVLRVAFLSALVLELVATLSTAVIAVEIGLRLLAGRLVFEQALFVLLLAPEFYLPLRLLGTRFHAGVAGVTAAVRIFEVLDTPETEDRRPMPSAARTPSRVVFENVSYIYPGGRVALQNVSFTIEPGQKVALVGPTGAGKSTIAALLLGWMPPSPLPPTPSPLLEQVPGEGRGWPSGRGWGEGIAWLPQTPYLFHDTIAANIRLGRPDASMDEVIAAAKAAHAHAFIQELECEQTQLSVEYEKEARNRVHPCSSASDFPGYDTLIGERGARLSGGQAQRIALARAFLMDAPFILLDEPTAHLDPALEAQLQDSLDRLLAGRSALIIAHRLNTVRRADKIIVLDEGRVVQQGTHAELAAQEGVYRELVEAQVAGGKLQVASCKQQAASEKQQAASNKLPDAESLTRRLAESPPNPLPLPRLLAFLRPYLGWVALSVLLGFLTIASSLGLMGASAYIISAAALQPSIAVLQVPIVGVRFFGLSRGIFRYLERLASHQTTFRVLAELRVWFYARLEPLAPARLQQLRSGDLLTRIVADIGSLENFYIRVVAPPLTALCVALLAGFLLMAYAPELALVLWIFLALGGILLPGWSFALARGVGAETLKARAALGSALVDGLQGLPDLLAFGRGPDHLQRIRGLGAQLALWQARFARRSGLAAGLMDLLTHLGMWTVLVLAIPRVTSGQIEGVYLAVVTLLALASFEAVQPLPLAAQHLAENLRAAERLFEIVDIVPEMRTPVDPQPVPEEQTLEVTNLRFGYGLQVASRKLQAALLTHHAQRTTHFTLHIPRLSLAPGGRVAIVGPSGAGKSTLLNLLLRFWEFEEGQITLGGVDVRTLDPAAVRAQFAVVSQHTHLFNASLRENLLLARPNATEAEIYAALAGAQLADFVRGLPAGLETFVGEQGLRLSGGERQRVAIGRALLKDAPFLILDEPTANLDARTEAAVLDSLEAVMAGRSVLLVTHRLTGLAAMDEIVVLRDGEIIERGNHAQLLARGGFYRRMWDVQNQQFGEAGESGA